MCDKPPQDQPIIDLWQSQKTEGVRMSVEQVQAGAGLFQRKIRRRNLREYVASAAVVAFFGYNFFRAGGNPLVRLGFGLIVAGTCYVAWHLHAQGSARPLPRDAGLLSFVDFQRRQLSRQRDLLRSVWRWYLGPLVPGMAVLIAAFALANPAHYPHMGLVVAVYAAVVAAVFIGIAKLNASAANKIQRQLDELEHLQK